jgi:hypothetical protein
MFYSPELLNKKSPFGQARARTWPLVLGRPPNSHAPQTEAIRVSGFFGARRRDEGTREAVVQRMYLLHAAWPRPAPLRHAAGPRPS